MDIGDLIAQGRVPLDDDEEEQTSGIGPRGRQVLQRGRAPQATDELLVEPTRTPVNRPAMRPGSPLAAADDGGPKDRYGTPIEIKTTREQPQLNMDESILQQEDWEKERSKGIRKERLQATPISKARDLSLEAAAGVGDIVSGAGALGQYLTGGDEGPISGGVKAAGKWISKSAEDLQSEAYQYVRKEEDFWDWNRPGAKIMGMVFRSIPSLIASGGVGGLAARGTIGAAGMVSTRLGQAVGQSAIPGMVGAGAAGGALNAGDVAQAIEDDVKQAPEAVLMSSSPYYKNMRDQGKSDEEARTELVKVSQGWKPIAAGVVGALSAFGMDATLANALAGKLAATGMIRGIGFGAGKEAAQEFVENASNEFLQQQAKVQTGRQREYDPEQIWKSGAMGAIVGGIIGGAGGAYFREGYKPTVVDSVASDPDKAAAFNATQPPPPPGTFRQPPPPDQGPPPGQGTWPAAPPGPPGPSSEYPPGPSSEYAPPGPASQYPPGPASQYPPQAPEGSSAYRQGLETLLNVARGGRSGDFEGTPPIDPTMQRGPNEPRNPEFIDELARRAWAEAGGDANQFAQIIRREAQRIYDSMGEPRIYEANLRREQAEAERQRNAPPPPPPQHQPGPGLREEGWQGPPAPDRRQRPPSQQELLTIRRGMQHVMRSLEEENIGMGANDRSEVARLLQEAVVGKQLDDNQFEQLLNSVIMRYMGGFREGEAATATVAPPPAPEGLRAETPPLRATTPAKPVAREYPPPLPQAPKDEEHGPFLPRDWEKPPMTAKAAAAVSVAEQKRRAEAHAVTPKEEAEAKREAAEEAATERRSEKREAQAKKQGVPPVEPPDEPTETGLERIRRIMKEKAERENKPELEKEEKQKEGVRAAQAAAPETGREQLQKERTAPQTEEERAAAVEELREQEERLAKERGEHAEEERAKPRKAATLAWYRGLPRLFGREPTPTAKPAEAPLYQEKGRRVGERVAVYKGLAERGVTVDEAMAAAIRSDVSGIAVKGWRQRRDAVQRIIQKYVSQDRATQEQAGRISEDEAFAKPQRLKTAEQIDVGKLTLAEITQLAEEQRAKEDAAAREALEKPEGKLPTVGMSGTKAGPARMEKLRQERLRLAWKTGWRPPETWPKMLKDLIAMVKYTGGKVDAGIGMQIRALYNTAMKTAKARRAEDLERAKAAHAEMQAEIKERIAALKKELRYTDKPQEVQHKIDRLQAGLRPFSLPPEDTKVENEPYRDELKAQVEAMKIAQKEWQQELGKRKSKKNVEKLRRIIELWEAELRRTEKKQGIDREPAEKQFLRDIHDIIWKFGAVTGKHQTAKWAYDKAKEQLAPTTVDREVEEAARIVFESMRQPTVEQAVEHFERKLRAQFNDEFIDDDHVTVDDVEVAVARVMASHRKDITDTVGKYIAQIKATGVVGRSSRGMLPERQATMEKEIRAELREMAKQHADTGLQYDPEEIRNEKLAARIAPAGTPEYVTRAQREAADRLAIRQELTRAEGGEREGSVRKYKSPKAILAESRKTIWAAVDREMADKKPQQWAVLLNNIRIKLRQLSPGKVDAKVRQQLNEQIDAIQIARANTVATMEAMLGGVSAYEHVQKIRRGVAEWRAGQGMYVEPEMETAGGSQAHQKRLGKLAKMEAKPSRIAGEKMREALKDTSAIGMHRALLEGQHEMVWTILEQHPIGGTTAATEEFASTKGPVIRVVGGKARKSVPKWNWKQRRPGQKRPTRTGQIERAETDAETLDRWREMVKDGEEAIAQAKPGEHIPMKFSARNTVEMNFLVLLKRSVEMGLPKRNLKQAVQGPSPMSPHMDNVRGLEAMLRASRGGEANEQLRDEFVNSFQDVMDRLRMLQPATSTNEHWDSVLEGVAQHGEWEDIADAIKQRSVEVNKEQGRDVELKPGKEGMTKEQRDALEAHNRGLLQDAYKNMLAGERTAAASTELAELTQRLTAAGRRAPVFDPLAGRGGQTTVYRKKGQAPTVLPGLGAPLRGGASPMPLGYTGVGYWPALPFTSEVSRQTGYPTHQVRKVYDYPMVYDRGIELGAPTVTFVVGEGTRHGQSRRRIEERARAREDEMAKAGQQDLVNEFEKDETGVFHVPRGTLDPMLAGVLDFDPKTAKAAPLEAGSYRAEDLLNRALRQTKRLGSFFIGKGLRFIQQAIAKRLNTLVGNMEVEVVSYQLFNDKGERVAAQFRPAADGRHRIEIDQEHFNTLPPAVQSWVLQHEMGHGATSVAYNLNLNNARALYDALFNQAKRSEIGADPRFEYAMRGAKEFIAEIRANPALQQAMFSMNSPGPAGAPTQMNMWRRFVQMVQNTLGLAFGGRPAENYLTHVLASIENQDLTSVEQMGGDVTAAMRKAIDAQPLPGTASEDDPLGVDAMITGSLDNVAAAFRSKVSDQGFWGTVKGAALQFEQTHGLLRWAKQGKYFTRSDGSDAYEDLVAEYEKIAPLIEAIQREGTVKASQLQDYIDATPEAKTGADTMFNASMWGYDHRYDLNHPNNGHLTEPVMAERYVNGKLEKYNTGMWATPAQQAAAKQSHARDHAEWLSMSPETQAKLSDAADYYKNTQKQLAGVIVNNIVDADIKSGVIMTPPGITKDTYIRYALSGRIKRAEAAKTADEQGLDVMLGEAKERLTHVMKMIQTEGLYVPFMRDGKFVVRAMFKVPRPTNGMVVPGQENTYAFDTATAAVAYAQQLETAGIYNTTKKHWVDAQGDRVREGTKDATPEWSVRAQAKHVEFFDSHAEAQAFADQAKTSGDFDDVKNAELVGPKWLTEEIRPAHIKSMYKAIDQNEHYSPSTRSALKQALDELGLRSMAGYRVQQHRIRRRNVRGYDKNLPNGMFRYSASMANHLGNTIMAPRIQELENEIVDMQRNRAGVGAPADTLARQRLVNEFQHRLSGSQIEPAAVVNQLKAASYLYWLAAPAASIINSTQVGAVTAPVLYGKYGDMSGVVKSIGEAYREIGAFKALKHAWSDVLAQTSNWGGKDEGPNPVGRIIDRVSPELRRLLRYAQSRGKLSIFAGIEFEQFDDRSKFWRGVSYAARIATALPQTIEAINRSVTLIATYKMARKHGASVQQAMDDAINVVDETQIDMSRRGRGRIFSNPWLALPLQFKQYPAAMISIWARNLAAVVGKNATPAEKAQARRTLLAMAMTTTLLAGASGLPWDIAKAMITAASMLGLMDDWDTLETGTQRWITGVMGGAGAEYVMRGLVRMAGIDVSNRVGHDAMVFGQLPKEATKGALWEYAGAQVFGAPGAMVANMFQATHAVAQGNWWDAAQKAPLPKMANDLVRAMRGYSEGKESPTGLPLMTEYTPFETAVRAIGFAPAKEAQTWEVGSAAKNKELKRANAELAKLKNEWARAETTDAKQRAWQKIKDLNDDNKETRGYNAATMGSLFRYKRGLGKRIAERREELEEDEEEMAGG